MSASRGTWMPNDSKLSSSVWSKAGWKGMPNASPNTKKPSRKAQTPPMAVTKKMRHQIDSRLIREDATSPMAMKMAPYPASPIMNPKKKGAAMNKNSVGSSSR